jgi:hypothetical protein
VIAQPADGEDFMVNIPAAFSPFALPYSVYATKVNVSVFTDLTLPDSLPTDRTATKFRVLTAAPLAAGDSIDFLVIPRTP